MIEKENLGFKAKVLKDSISYSQHRLTTLELTFPRFILPEFNTHRALSRNSASSRAIPISKQIEKVLQNPFIPFYVGKNQKGMQAYQQLDENEKARFKDIWLSARDKAVDHASSLEKLGVHKQLTNRILEPFMWHTVICTATEWKNFLALRCHPAAQPEIQQIALLIYECLKDSIPELIESNEWHLPLTEDYQALLDDDKSIEEICKITAGRCARVSYLTHDGKRSPQADLDLANQLLQDGHMSPFEHLARPAEKDEISTSNFKGWIQFRKTIPNEEDYSHHYNKYGDI